MRGQRDKFPGGVGRSSPDVSTDRGERRRRRASDSRGETAGVARELVRVEPEQGARSLDGKRSKSRLVDATLEHAVGERGVGGGR